MTKITVGNEFSDSRLDMFLLSQFDRSKITRSMLEKQIKESVMVNGKRAKKGLFLKVGDIVEFDQTKIVTKQESEKEILPIEGKLDIIDETVDYIVLNKPAGVPVHPGKGHVSDTVANHLRYYLEQKNEYDINIKRGGIVHRLDMDVSGLMICAKNRKTQLELQQLFETGQVIKLYKARLKALSKMLPESKLSLKTEISKFVKNGYEPDGRWIKVEGYIARDPSNRMRMRLNIDKGRSGRYALTYILPLKNKEALINIKTGRMHQIRATVKAMGWVVEGDQLYGDAFQAGSLSLTEIILKLKVAQEEKIWKLV